MIAVIIASICITILCAFVYIGIEEEAEQQARIQACLNSVASEGKGGLKQLLDERDR